MKRLRNNKGFSLVELLVVVAILGVMTALVIPKISSSSSASNVKTSAREFLTNVRYTRERAISMVSHYTIKISVKPNGQYIYGIYKGDDSTTTTLENGFEFPVGVQVDNSSYLVTFDESGNCVVGKNSGTLVITSADGSASRSVIVYSATGMSRIE